MWRSIAVLWLLAACACAGTLESRVLAPSVTVSAGQGTGSGVIFVRGERCFVLTAAHVVAGLRDVVMKLEGGQEKKYETFKDAAVAVILYEGDRKVGKVEMDAEVLAYSDDKDGEDLALLEIRKRAFIKEAGIFRADDNAMPIGTRLYHCGSLQGEMGSNSLTDGIISRVGRVWQGKVFEQSSVTAFPGSSGGGVFTEGGEYIGMITRGAGETFNLFIPTRRIRAWLRVIKYDWVVNPELPVPAVGKPAEAAKPLVAPK